MMIDTESMVPFERAEQDFSQVLRLVDRFGSALIIKDDLPRYLVLVLSRPENGAHVPDMIDLKTGNESE